MVSVKKAVYDVKERLKLTTDDVDISTEYIHHLLNLERSKYIKQKFVDYRKTIPDSILQGITLDMELVDRLPGITTADKVLRSKIVVPEFINLEGRSDYIQIRSRDFLSIPFSFVTFDRFAYVGNDKWNPNHIYLAIGPDDRLYLKSGSGYGNTIKMIVMYSIFEDPEVAWTRSINYDSSVNYIDTEYPLSGELLSLCVSEVVNKLANTMNVPEDKINDSNETRG